MIILLLLFFLLQATPAAHVRWLKDDLPLNLDPTRMILLPSGALELEQVQLMDQVIYCYVLYNRREERYLSSLSTKAVMIMLFIYFIYLFIDFFLS